MQRAQHPSQPAHTEQFPVLQKQFAHSTLVRLVRLMQHTKLISRLTILWTRRWSWVTPYYHTKELLLHHLLQGFAKSTYGKQHSLVTVPSPRSRKILYASLQKLPITTYEPIQAVMMRPGWIRNQADELPVWSQSWGTSSGTPKRIRMVKQVLIANKLANRVVFRYLSKHVPNHHILDGTLLPQVWSFGPISIDWISGEGCDVSAFIVKSQSPWIQAFYAYHPLILTASNLEKIAFIVETIADKEISCIMGSTIRVEELIKQIYTRYHGTPIYTRFVNRLELLLCGGMPIDPRLPSFASYAIRPEIIWWIYNSAEGMRAHEVRGIRWVPPGRWYKRFTQTHIVEYTPSSNVTDQQQLIDPDCLYLPETLLVNPSLLHDHEYSFFAIVTTYALPRYLMNDQLALYAAQDDDGERFLAEQILGRDHGINERGEELMEADIDFALDELRAQGYHCGNFAIHAFSDEQGETPIRRHERILELEDYPWSAEQLSLMIDDLLQDHTHDYRAKRAHDTIITHPPLITIVPIDTLKQYLQGQQGKYGGQAKIKQIYRSEEREAFLHLRNRCIPYS